MARSRRPGSSKSWDQLSPGYRDRLKGAGITRQAWLSGADLRGARSHVPGPPPGAAPFGATERVVQGEGTTADLRAVREWHDDHGAEYPGMSMDTAAALSQIHTPVEQWDHVHFDPKPDGEAWTMTIFPKDGRYPETVEVPGGGAADTPGASEILEMLADEEIDFDTEYEKTA
jgi:hypothetical protein